MLGLETWFQPQYNFKFHILNNHIGISLQGWHNKSSTVWLLTRVEILHFFSSEKYTAPKASYMCMCSKLFVLVLYNLNIYWTVINIHDILR
jgi:hypothetical protein